MALPSAHKKREQAMKRVWSFFAWLVSRRRYAVVTYPASIAAVIFATMLRVGMDPALSDHHPFTLYFAAVVFASWYGGFGPGVVAIGLSYFSADWFFIRPRFEINWPRENLDEFLALVAFLFSGFAIAITTSLMRRGLSQARQKQEELEREISVRQEAEKALHEAQVQLRQHADLLEERVAERTRYLRETILSLEGVCYHLAHDLRAPLRAMGGYTHLLLSECAASLDATGQSYAGKIVQAAERMDLLINGLMEYGRLGHEDYRMEPIQLRLIVKRLISQLSNGGKYPEVTLGETWPEVLGNVVLLELVIYHLLSNAFKFTRPSVVTQLRIWMENRAGSVRVWIEDNGIGVPMEYADKVFGIFQRLHPVGQYPGTGIGLAIVAKAISRMKGRVGVEANPKGGSRFWFELRLAPVNSPSVLEQKTEPENLLVGA
jgi:signal transduction histidine kinase